MNDTSNAPEATATKNEPVADSATPVPGEDGGNLAGLQAMNSQLMKRFDETMTRFDESMKQNEQLKASLETRELQLKTAQQESSVPESYSLSRLETDIDNHEFLKGQMEKCRNLGMNQNQFETFAREQWQERQQQGAQQEKRLAEKKSLFGEGDYNRIVDYAKRQGFTDESISRMNIQEMDAIRRNRSTALDTASDPTGTAGSSAFTVKDIVEQFNTVSRESGNYQAGMDNRAMLHRMIRSVSNRNQ